MGLGGIERPTSALSVCSNRIPTDVHGTKVLVKALPNIFSETKYFDESTSGVAIGLKPHRSAVG